MCGQVDDLLVGTSGLVKNKTRIGGEKKRIGYGMLINRCCCFVFDSSVRAGWSSDDIIDEPK
jgi:hypothetical protein